MGIPTWEPPVGWLSPKKSKTWDTHMLAYLLKGQNRVRALISSYITLSKRPYQEKKEHYLHGWQWYILSSKERTCVCVNDFLSTRPLCFVKLTPGEWDNVKLHPQAEWAILQVTSWPILQRQFPETGATCHTITMCGPAPIPKVLAA